MLAVSHTHSHERQGNASDPVFIAFRERLQARFAERVAEGTPLFTTDAGDLWGSYLASFPPETRQSHNCNACHHFIRRYGGLVTIGEDGAVLPAFWDPTDAPAEYLEAVEAIRYRVRRAKVTGVFLSSDALFGTLGSDPKNWIHYGLIQRKENAFASKTQSPYQAMAEKLEDRKNVATALAEISVTSLETAVQLLKSDALYRSEKVLGQAEWLLRLALVRRDTRHAFANALWLAVAKAPAGFCHPRSSMIGTLLDDLSSGLPFAEVAGKFKYKMSPLVYQRPQAAPKAGAIAQAEKLVDQLGIARSLERRFARLDEVQALWTPTPPPARKSEGVFGHLQVQTERTRTKLAVPALGMSWAKFARTVLTDAKQIELNVPSVGSFTALVTAVHPDAPPILQWDTEAQRNPVSWYMYVGGSPAIRWGLRTAWTPVTAVALQPSMWFGDKFEHQGKGAIFLLDGARDAHSQSLALFPEILKSELHGVRSVIEAHSRIGRISGVEESTACGIAFNDKLQPVNVRVTHATGVAVEYKIDRWE